MFLNGLIRSGHASRGEFKKDPKRGNRGKNGRDSLLLGWTGNHLVKLRQQGSQSELKIKYDGAIKDTCCLQQLKTIKSVHK